jgi:hypothetical protein
MDSVRIERKRPDLPAMWDGPRKRAKPVDARVGNVRNDAAGLIAPVSLADAGTGKRK